MTGTDGWVRLTHFESTEEAATAGAALLESGIVATLDDDRGPGPVTLMVQSDDARRASEVLGVPEPAARVLPLEEPLPPEVTRWRLPRERLGLFIVGYVVVLVMLCVAVFFVVAWLLGGYDSTEMPTRTVP